MGIQAASYVASGVLARSLASSGFLQPAGLKCLGAAAASAILPQQFLHTLSPRWCLQKQQCPSGVLMQAASFTSSNAAQQQQDDHKATPNEQAQQVSKAFLTNVLDMEDLWLKGVGGQLKMWAATKKVPPFEDEKQHEAVVERVRAAYIDTFQRAAEGRMLSHRARSHLKQACLAAATYKQLLQEAPDSGKAVEEFIGFSMGGVYSGFMVGGLKLTSWAKRLLLRESSVSQAVDTLHTIARDMEGACHCSVQPLSASGDSDDDELLQQQQQEQQEQQQQIEDPEAAAEAEAAKLHTQYEWHSGASLTVDSCMIAEVLQQEGVPQLLRYFCCQHNMTWLEAYKGQGVESKLEACIGKGDGCCRMTVTTADSS